MRRIQKYLNTIAAYFLSCTGIIVVDLKYPVVV